MQTALDKLLKELKGTLDLDATHDFIDGIRELLSIPEIDKAVHTFIFHPDNIENYA